MFPHIHFQLEENDIIIQHLPVLRLKKIVKFAQKPSSVALQFELHHPVRRYLIPAQPRFTDEEQPQEGTVASGLITRKSSDP